MMMIVVMIQRRKQYTEDWYSFSCIHSVISLIFKKNEKREMIKSSERSDETY